MQIISEQNFPKNRIKKAVENRKSKDLFSILCVPLFLIRNSQTIFPNNPFIITFNLTKKGEETFQNEKEQNFFPDKKYEKELGHHSNEINKIELFYLNNFLRKHKKISCKYRSP